MTSKTLISGGLGRKLLINILTMVVIPLLLMSLLVYKIMSDQLTESTLNQLNSISSIQASAVSYYFERVLLDLSMESQRQSNVDLLAALTTGFQDSGKNLSNFIKSFQWAMLTDEKGNDLKTFWSAYDFHDILLIDSTGNLLFSFAKEADLGTNLLTGDYSYSRFSAAIKKSLETGQAAFSDLEYYAPSSETAGFFTDVLVDEYGDIIGVIAFQINDKRLNELIHGQEKMGSLEVYLTGEDLILRTKSNKKQVSENLSSSIKNAQTQSWVEDNIFNQSTKDQKVKFIHYNDDENRAIMGLFKPIKVADLTWIMIAEIEESIAFSSVQTLLEIIFMVFFANMVIVLIIAFPLIKKIVDPITKLSSGVYAASQGNFDVKVSIHQKNELGVLASGFNTMVSSLRQRKSEVEEQTWLENGVSKLNDVMRGEQNIHDLSRHVIGFLCQYINAQVGAFYLHRDQSIKLSGSYAFKSRKGFVNEFQVGEGIVGQAVLEKQPFILSDLPDNYMNIGSGLGDARPRVLSVYPIIWNEQVVAVLEFASLTSFPSLYEQLLDLCSSMIAADVRTTVSRDETRELLVKTQTQAEALQAREEELRESNTILEAQSNKLEKSASELEEKNIILQSQQEELKASNEELEIKARELEASQNRLEEKNSSLDIARSELEQKANDLAISSKYKSEFLANMSHELRTPLNSLLILAKLLSDNKDKNLSDKQTEYAATIHDSGTDLLNLINDILDLSKIEAGRMEIHIESIHLKDLAIDMERQFQPQAEKKAIRFTVNNDFSEETIHSDRQKLGQILKNLLSNAFKFTENGSVTVCFSDIQHNIKLNAAQKAEDFLQVTVQDTGLGIPLEKQNAIFEAFQQADGATNRKFGGTGLGLSISRELAKLLGGEIQLNSELGKGSTFSVIINKNQRPNGVPPRQNLTQLKPISEPFKKPIKHHEIEVNEAVAPLETETVSDIACKEEVHDDRRMISPDDRSLLIIEDDVKFSSILADIAKEKGFKVLIAEDGETGLHFADYYKPSGIILDIGLPGIDGWEVMERLKNNLETRHIPVHFMSGQDQTIDAFRSGAMGYLTKPISMDLMEQTLTKIGEFIEQPVKHLLVVEDDKVQCDYIIDLIDDTDVAIDIAKTARQAMEKLRNKHYDCIVLDLRLPDMNGIQLLESIRMDNGIEEIPLLIYSVKEIDDEEKAIINQYANSIIIKSARSPEVLLDETALFLHRVGANMAEEKQQMIRMLHDNEAVLNGRNVLVVDDDMRNVFSLTTMLRDKGVVVVTAKNGLDALQKLQQMKSPDLVLMDIMMPEMDGYEAMKKIREQEKYQELPIIALTAKAMKGDRSKCIKAGANDYLSKPIDTDKLLSMMRVWLYR